jgi:4-hydroxy-tetrahydrodipicolinate reductase
MMRVAVSGAYGRMGQLACAVVDAAPDLLLGPLYAPGHAEDELFGQTVTDHASRVADADVVVEFCTPGAVLENLAKWHDMGVHAVVGTSGFDEDRIATVSTFWTGEVSRCLIVPNFAIGAVLMMRFAELAAPHFSAAEIIELHHDRKADAPSGTALNTAERISAAQPNQVRSVQPNDGGDGALGTDVNGVRVHSVRLPGIVANQEVIFGAVGQTLTIRHDTTDRTAFGPGIELAIRQIANLSDPVTVGIDGLL